MKKFYNCHTLAPIFAMQNLNSSDLENDPEQDSSSDKNIVTVTPDTDASNNGYVNGNIDVAAALEEYYRSNGRTE